MLILKGGIKDKPISDDDDHDNFLGDVMISLEDLKLMLHNESISQEQYDKLIGEVDTDASN